MGIGGAVSFTKHKCSSLCMAAYNFNSDEEYHIVKLYIVISMPLYTYTCIPLKTS